MTNAKSLTLQELDEIDKALERGETPSVEDCIQLVRDIRAVRHQLGRLFHSRGSEQVDAEKRLLVWLERQ